MTNAFQPPHDPLSGPARLRRLSIAEVLDSALRLYRANFRAFSTAVASVVVTMAMLQAIYWRNADGSPNWQELSPLRSEALLGAISLLRGPIDPFDLILVFASDVLLYLIARVLLVSILVHITARSYLGPFGASLPARTRGLRREIALIPAIVLMLPLDLASALVARGAHTLAPLVAALLQGTTPPFMFALDTLLLLGRVLLIVIPMILLSARFFLAPQTVMLERRSAFASLGRSWRLIGGWFWRVALVGLATSALVGLLIGLPVALVRLLPGVSDWRWVVGGAVAAQVLEALALPFQVAVFTVLFYDIRIRKEGYDLEVLAQQAAEVGGLLFEGRPLKLPLFPDDKAHDDPSSPQPRSGPLPVKDSPTSMPLS